MRGWIINLSLSAVQSGKVALLSLVSYKIQTIKMSIGKLLTSSYRKKIHSTKYTDENVLLQFEKWLDEIHLEKYISKPTLQFSSHPFFLYMHTISLDKFKRKIKFHYFCKLWLLKLVFKYKMPFINWGTVFIYGILKTYALIFVICNKFSFYYIVASCCMRTCNQLNACVVHVFAPTHIIYLSWHRLLQDMQLLDFLFFISQVEHKIKVCWPLIILRDPTF